MGGKSRVLALDRSQYVGAGKEPDSKTTGKVYDVFLSLISARNRPVSREVSDTDRLLSVHFMSFLSGSPRTCLRTKLA